MAVAACSTHKTTEVSQALRLPAQESDNKFIAHDWTGDGPEDHVVLLPPKEGSDFHELAIIQGMPDEVTQPKILSVKNLVYAHSNPGASLELLPNHSFNISIDHTGIGRMATVQTFTISYRSGKFILSGYSFTEWDRIDPKTGGSCELNLLSGQGRRNGKKIRFSPVRKELQQIDGNYRPAACGI